jgi:hypothetical protein
MSATLWKPTRSNKRSLGALPFVTPAHTAVTSNSRRPYSIRASQAAVAYPWPVWLPSSQYPEHDVPVIATDEIDPIYEDGAEPHTEREVVPAPQLLQH